jgi:ATP-dependent helicase Lhr and Lhr-like helicase
MNPESSLEAFHPVVRNWFQKTFGEPSPPQRLGWPSIASGKHTLIVAPTGSGKTLAAFLWCINRLVEEDLKDPGSPRIEKSGKKSRRSPKNEKLSSGVRVLYVSPLKALNNDIHRNLELPLEGIHNEARSTGIQLSRLQSAVRTGDTPQSERLSIAKDPPDILITTPESLYLMLSSPRVRKIFCSVRYVIIDEIHSISGNKRGVHLSISLERLEKLAPQSFVRIGLSATQRPLEVIAQFLGGQQWNEGRLVPREVAIIDAGYKKQMDLQVACVVPDFSDLPNDSIWNLVFPRIIKEILQHRTTLIFVNNRRLAEHVAARLNELLTGREHTFNLYAVPRLYSQSQSENRSSDIVIQAYHGSMSRAAREKMETELKAGTLRALVATSALELGIDIGSIDLVIQIQSPKGIARGLQRVGRSGHLVSATSTGRIFITHRQDLVESAVVAKAMEEHAIEETHVPQDCLDVLAQQIVAMVGVEEWDAGELYNCIRQSYCYRSLSQKIFSHVLQMLAGRYTNEAFRQLRARISWDKARNKLSPLPGSAHLAITNAGTIPDRGYFAVYLEDLKTKIGEVDEEFIYESRTGDTFILGSNVWKMTDIDVNKVIVAPAPGEPARMPFWRGEGIGRTFELGERIGDFLRGISTHLADADTIEWLQRNFPLDSFSAQNILLYVSKQKAATGVVPSHRDLVIEGFRDEIGDPRIVVHSCYGKGVNGLLGLVLSRQLKDRLGIDIQMLYNDDGILFRCSDVERLPLDLFSTVDFERAHEIVIEELMMSPLFSAMFRQNAERALLLPKTLPGKRTPLFLQRLRAGDLLQIARKFDDFPIVIETIRDCLNDVLDFDHFKKIMHDISNGEISLHTVTTEAPSPFATSVLFDFMSVYIYEQDRPRGELERQHLSLNREVLTEIINLDAPSRVLKPEAITRVEDQLQFTADTRKARTADELFEIFLRLGEMTEQEIFERCTVPAKPLVQILESRGSIIEIHIGSTNYFISAEETPLFLHLGTIAPEKLEVVPEEFRKTFASETDALRFAIARMLRSHGPVSAGDIAFRYGKSIEDCENILKSFPESEDIICGSFTSEAQQWCYRPNLERIHRASLSILRKEITPACIAQFTEFLARWQHRHPSTVEIGDEGVRSVLEQVQSLALPAEIWEREILQPRVKGYQSSALRLAVSQGEIICSGTLSGKTQWIFRGEGAFFLNDDAESVQPLPETAKAIHSFLKDHGASFLADLRQGTDLSLASINRAIADLFWNGLITNDVPEEVLNIKRFRTGSEANLPDERIILTNPRRNPLRYTAMQSVRTALRKTPGWSGRWSLVHTPSVLGDKVTLEEKVERQVRQLLLRYGIVARELAKREDNLLPWSLLAFELQKMEMRGEIRRGYFVKGLFGMQYALPAAVDLLRAITSDRTADKDQFSLAINACDPAQPYGAGIEVGMEKFPPGMRIIRHPLHHFVLQKGEPVVWIENFGKRIFAAEGTSLKKFESSMEQFISYLRYSHPNENAFTLEYVDSERPADSTFHGVLQSLGFYRDKAQTMRLELR